MNKKELVSEISEQTGLTKKDSELALEATMKIVKDEVKKGNKISLIGFGNFEPKSNAARTGINPATKEKIQIKASKSVKFKVAKPFKEHLN